MPDALPPEDPTVDRFQYVALMGACVLITLPLEVGFDDRVWRRPRRLALAMLPALVLFVAWPPPVGPLMPPIYPTLAVIAALGVIALERWGLRTGLFREPAYWISLVICLAFMIPVDGVADEARVCRTSW